jgi:hypothetical protein
MRPAASTLRTLKASLEEEYVRMVLAQVRSCEQSLGDAQVRVCLDDEIDPPHYCIDAVMDPDTGETTNWESFSGRTHLVLSDHQRRRVTWSSHFMTFRQLSELIGEIRNYSSAPPRRP